MGRIRERSWGLKIEEGRRKKAKCPELEPPGICEGIEGTFKCPS
jgi:hypothetical protein